MPLSVTEPILPELGVTKLTVAPPEVRLVPLASLSCTVMVVVPLVGITGGLTDTVEVVAEGVSAQIDERLPKIKSRANKRFIVIVF